MYSAGCVPGVTEAQQLHVGQMEKPEGKSRVAFIQSEGSLASLNPIL